MSAHKSTAPTPPSPPEHSASAGASPHRVPSDSSFQSPARHHFRVTSSSRKVKETRNARSQYSNSEDDGASQLRINQYVIQQEIGRGSFGAVHLATDQYGQEYAVKEFSKTRLRRRAKSNMLRRPRARLMHEHQHQQQQPADGSQRQGIRALLESRFSFTQTLHTGMEDVDNSFDLIKEEIAIMKKLNHPNLVSLIEVLDDPEGDSLFMVLEMCKKGVIMKVSIDETADPYPDEACRLWFRDLILGIEYLHSQGIVHRDIKPDNCLLTDDDTLKVVDFGVSEMFEKDSNMRIAKSAGSPAFMAPELCVVHRGAVSGKPADIWSMGVTLYCLKFGRVPFEKEAVIDLYKAIVEDPVCIPDDCEPELADLIRRVLEKDPEKRITMAQLRQHPWVTCNGEDTLLPEEENCAETVTEPTDEEMDAAITSNMARVMAMMKAVNRFKTLIHRDRHDVVNSFLGAASKYVWPPKQMTKEELEAAPTANTSLDTSEPEIATVKQRFLDQGDTLGAELAARIERLPRSLRHFLISEHNGADTPPRVTSPSGLATPDASGTGSSGAAAESSALASAPPPSKSPLAKSPPPLPPRSTPGFSATLPASIPKTASTDDDEIDEERVAPLLARHAHQHFVGKGQAHDPLEDSLFLNIGLGPSSYSSFSPKTDGAADDGSNMPLTATDPSSEPCFVSESPTATEDNIYERAFADQVAAIRKERGTQSTVYLTRRVESRVSLTLKQWQLSPDQILASLPSGDIDETWRKRDRAKHGFATVVGRAISKATQYADDAERRMEESKRERMHPTK